VKGTVSYAGQVIVEKKLTPIKLPGRVSVPSSLGTLIVTQAKSASAANNSH